MGLVQAEAGSKKCCVQGLLGWRPARWYRFGLLISSRRSDSVAATAAARTVWWDIIRRLQEGVLASAPVVVEGVQTCM